MAKLLVLGPLSIASVYSYRGVNAANLITPDPKEVWADTDVGTATALDIDLGAVVAIDTVFLGTVDGAVAGATWSLSGGTVDPTSIPIQSTTALRVPDAAGQAPAISHAFWTGATLNVRYIQLTLAQPAGNRPLTAGILMVGKAFLANLGHEWGAGRKVIDTGSSTALPSGGFAVVEGARKASFSWTFGDLTSAEVDALYALQLDRGETRPLLVAEDPAMTTGLRWRLHYGKLTTLRQFERRNPAQTRWEMTVEEWI